MDTYQNNFTYKNNYPYHNKYTINKNNNDDNNNRGYLECISSHEDNKYTINSI